MDLKRFSIALSAVFFAQSAVVAETWTTDYSAGLASARQRDRAVFLFFTGSDWCGYCQALDRDVLSTPQFASFADENLVLVKVDFPHNTSLPPGQAERNEALARGFGIHGFPTILIINPKGQAVGKLGYRPGTPGELMPRCDLAWNSAASEWCSRRRRSGQAQRRSFAGPIVQRSSTPSAEAIQSPSA